MRRLLRQIITRHDRVRLQILSDLHLEIGKQYMSFSFPAIAPYLLLAGDVGRLVDYDLYLAFLQSLSTRYKKVFLVLGNHEFYGLDYESGLLEAQRLVRESVLADTVVLLHRTRWDDPDSSLTILGCTLWSDIPEHRQAIVQARVKDFVKIPGWSVQAHNKVHADEVAWLRSQVERLVADEHDKMNISSERRCRQLLVATHHAPLVKGTSHPDHEGNPWACAFATDVLVGPTWDMVKVWVFGHTHYSTDFCLQNGTRVVANQRGYVLPGAENARSFSANVAVTLKR